MSGDTGGVRSGRFDATSPKLVALALFAFAVALRAFVATRIAAIFNDGPHFILMARLMGEGRWADALTHPYHPAYPVTIWLTSPFATDWEQAGVVASVLAGGLAVVALYALLWSAFDPTTAWIGALLLALHPYAALFSADVQSEGLYLACFLAAAACTWRGHASEQAGRGVAFAFGGGCFAGLAYLVRPEGLGIALAAVGLAGLSWLAGRTSLTRAVRESAAVSLGVALLASPYVLSLHASTGDWMLTRKKSVGSLMATEDYRPVALGVRRGREDTDGAAPASDPAPPVEALEPIGPPTPAPPAPPAEPPPTGAARVGSALLELLATAAATLRPELVLLTVLGLTVLRGRPGDRGLFFAAIFALYAVVLFGLTFNVGYLSRRHVLPPLVPLLGYAAVGLPWLGGRVVSGARRLLGREGPPAPPAAVAVGLVLIAALALPKVLKPRRLDRMAERRAGEWLAEREDLRGPVAAAAARTAFYAGEHFVPLRLGGHDTLATLQQQGVRFVVVEEERIDRYRGLRAGLDEQLRLIHRERAEGESAVVLELLREPR